MVNIYILLFPVIFFRILFLFLKCSYNRMNKELQTRIKGLMFGNAVMHVTKHLSLPLSMMLVFSDR